MKFRSSRLILQSGLPALIRGAKLSPKPHPRYPNLAWTEEGKQGICYHLQASNQRSWILKKFHSSTMPEPNYLNTIRNLLPSDVAFSSGVKRATVTSKDIKPGQGLYHNSEFSHWIEDTVLMPKVPGVTWNRVAQELRKGTFELSADKRAMFAKSLAEAITILEENGCAHRDLSHQNLLFDVQEYIIYLVDWDSMFHGSLYFHKNLPSGTEGYLPPWVFDKSGKCDLRKTWQAKGDRFSLAIMLSEILTVGEGTPSYGDGSLFNQDILRTPNHAELLKLREAVNNISPDLRDLLSRTLAASSYEDCPKPREWLDVLSSIEAAQPSMGETTSDDTDTAVSDEESYDDDYAISPKKISYILFLLIILFPLVSWGIYQFQQRQHAHAISPSNPTPPVETSSSTIPQTLIVSPDHVGTIVNNVEYFVTIEYPDKDLQMTINGQPIQLDKNNSARVNIKPGWHDVTLVFSSVFFDSKGNLKSGPIAPHSKKVRFEPDQTKIKISIDRETQTWEYRSHS